MRISTEALPQHFEPAVNWIGGLIGAALDKRVAGFESQERANPLLASHFRENFALEFALAKARKYRKSNRAPGNHQKTPKVREWADSTDPQTGESSLDAFLYLLFPPFAHEPGCG
jgi:hypothetical protein